MRAQSEDVTVSIGEMTAGHRLLPSHIVEHPNKSKPNHNLNISILPHLNIIETLL